jgi:DNA-binding IclR family transcriptional regulator
MNDGPRVKTTQTSFRIIEAVRNNHGAGVSELARTVNLSKSAVHKHVQTQIDIGYLVRENDAYYLSNRFLGLGQPRP